MRTRPLLRIDLEREPQKVLEHRRQDVLFLDRRRAIGSNQKQRPQRRLREIRGLAFNHLNSHDTQTPDINLAAVLFARDDFGCHPVRGADHGGAFHLGLVDLGAEAEVGELDMTVEVEEDVVGFDVAVDDALGVEELKAMEGLAADGGDLALGHHVKGHDIGQTAAFHVLHDHPEVALDEEGIHEVDDVLVSTIFHDEDFIDDEVLFGLLFEIHLLDGDALVRADFERGVDTSRCALTDFDEAAVFLRWIAGIADLMQLRNDFSVAD